MTVEAEEEWGAGPSQQAEHIDSMAVATTTVDDTCWTGVSNEPLNYDYDTNTVDTEEDGDEPQMEVPMDDDLCTAQMMARSVVANLEFSGEKFSACCEQNGFAIGMVFRSKEEFLHQLTEWSILHGVSYKPIKSNKTIYTAVCSVDGP